MNKIRLTIQALARDIHTYAPTNICISTYVHTADQKPHFLNQGAENVYVRQNLVISFFHNDNTYVYYVHDKHEVPGRTYGLLFFLTTQTA